MQESAARKILRHLGATVQNVSRKGYLQCSCPLAKWTHKKGSDGRPSFGLKNDGSHFFCFACKRAGNAADLVSIYQAYSGGNYSELLDFVHTKLEFDCVFLRPDTEEVEPVVFHEDYLGFFSEPSDKARKYLKRRHVSSETISEMGILYDIQKNMVVFPIRGIDGELRGAQGRSIGSRKGFHFYWAEEGFLTGLVLGNHQNFRDCANLFVFESMLDMLRHWPVIRDELDGTACCTFNANVTPQQAAFMDWSDYTIYSCFDNDKAGSEGHKKLMGYLGRLKPVKRMKPPSGKDFNQVSKESFVKIFNKS